MHTKNILGLIFLFLFGHRAQSQVCDTNALTSLQNNVSSIPEALKTIGNCLDYLDTVIPVHIKSSDQTSYCKNDPADSPELQLAHFESRLSAMEGSANTYCCSIEECQANCPNNTNLSANTCDPECKPHAPGLITSLDVKTRIQNVANRIRAVTPFITYSGAPHCTASSQTSTSQTTPPAGQTTSGPIEVTGLNGSPK